MDTTICTFDYELGVDVTDVMKINEPLNCGVIINKEGLIDGINKFMDKNKTMIADILPNFRTEK